MRFNDYLKEEYTSRADDGYGGSYEIFMNPTIKEIKGIKDAYLRCVVDFEKKDLYVFSHFLIHANAMKTLERVRNLHSWTDGNWTDLKSDSNNNYAFCSVKLTSSGKLEFYRTDTGAAFYRKMPPENFSHIFKWMQMDDKWLNKWFTEPFIETYINSCASPRTWR
jgi:hypothetical protein